MFCQKTAEFCHYDSTPLFLHDTYMHYYNDLVSHSHNSLSIIYYILLLIVSSIVVIGPKTQQITGFHATT